MAKQLSDKQRHFNALWIAETIRLQEEQQGILADNEAIRQAKVNGGDFQQRILTRAEWLADKTHLLIAQQGVINAHRWTIRILMLLTFFLGIGLVLPTFSSQNHTINIFSALGCLLGLNLVMMAVWLLGALLGGDSLNHLGKFILWLTSKLTGKQQIVQLLPALLMLFHQQRLERWWIGRVTNILWLSTSVIALVTLLVLLATQRYGFIWQTTILSSDSFVFIVQLLGAIPHVFGFPIPSEELIRQSGNGAVMFDTARQTWAAWLVGVLFVYGIFPRILFFILCTLLLRAGYRHLSLNLSFSGYALLRPRLMPDKEMVGIIDCKPDNWYEPMVVNGNWSEQGAAVVGLELEANSTWPPHLPKGVINAGRIETREQRKHLLDRLAATPVAKLLIICDPKRSVDRGTLNLISELACYVRVAKVALLVDEGVDTKRLADWQQALQRLQLAYDDLATLLTWLGDAND